MLCFASSLLPMSGRCDLEWGLSTRRNAYRKWKAAIGTHRYANVARCVLDNEVDASCFWPRENDEQIGGVRLQLLEDTWTWQVDDRTARYLTWRHWSITYRSILVQQQLCGCSNCTWCLYIGYICCGVLRNAEKFWLHKQSTKVCVRNAMRNC